MIVIVSSPTKSIDLKKFKLITSSNSFSIGSMLSVLPKQTSGMKCISGAVLLCILSIALT